MAKKRQVFLAWTTNETLGWRPEVLKVYSATGYQAAYNWLADLAIAYGGKPGGNYPTPGSGKVVASVFNQANGQKWWIERHEVCNGKDG